MYKRGYTQPYNGVLSLSFTDSEHSARGALDEHADKRNAFIRWQMHELVRTAHAVPCDNRPTWPCLWAVPWQRAASLALHCTSALHGRSSLSRCTVSARIRVGNGTASHGKP